MRKFVKNNLLEIFGTLYEAHSSVKSLIEQNKYDDALSLLGECQNTAVDIGGVIESSEGEGFSAIHLLEDYCEVVYQVSVGMASEIDGVTACGMLNESLGKAECCVRDDIKIRLEKVFMPYKASMWDSLEGAWKEANDDPDCDAYVIPIPYYERNPDRSFGTYHYEGKEFPQYVPIVYYDDYDLEARRPDEIYIHNPYDDINFVTSVDPRFYSSVLKEYTDCLVYIPYFVLAEGSSTKGFSTAPGVVYADKVIVQSEAFRQNYIRDYKNEYGNRFGDPEKKFFVGKSSKFEKACNDSKEQYTLPEEWNKLIGDRKVIFYNTSLSAMLTDTLQYIKKVRSVLSFFQEREDVVLWWRPHPLMRATINSMRNDLLTIYDMVVNLYIKDGFGIYDDTSDLHRAIAYSDAYYGDRSSVLELYKTTNKPIMIQNIYID